MTEEKPNRRRCRRVTLEARVTWMQGDGSTVRGASGRASDISEGGISAFLPADLAIGQMSAIEFSLPNCKDVFRVKVIARTRDSFRYGFEFVTLSATQRQHISRWCATLPELDSPAKSSGKNPCQEAHLQPA